MVLCTNNDEVNLLGCAFAKRVYSEQVGDRATRGLTTIAKIRDPTLLDKIEGQAHLKGGLEQIISSVLLTILSNN